MFYSETIAVEKTFMFYLSDLCLTDILSAPIASR